MKEGEIVFVEVDKSETYAVFVNYKGIKGIVQVPDIQWDYPILFENYPKAGDRVRVEILKVIQEAQAPVSFRASIKHANPDENPWKDPSIFQVGCKHKGEVIKSTEYGYVVKIKSGAYAVLLNEYVTSEVKIGSIIDVIINRFELESKRLEVHLNN